MKARSARKIRPAPPTATLTAPQGRILFSGECSLICFLVKQEPVGFVNGKIISIPAAAEIFPVDLVYFFPEFPLDHLRKKREFDIQVVQAGSPCWHADLREEIVHQFQV